MRRADFIERGVKLLFRRQLLDDGFDDDVTRFQVLEIGGAAQTSAGSVAIILGQRAFGDHAAEILLDRLQSLFEELWRHFARDDVVPSLCGHLGDPRAHQSTSDHTYCSNRHC